MTIKPSYIYNKVKSIVTADLQSAVTSLHFQLLSLAIIVFLFSSCDAENSISTTYPCRFVFYTNLHPGTSIETALTGTSNFTIITTKYQNNVWHIFSTLNDGRNYNEDIVTTTAKEQRINYSLGANNGIFVGCSSYIDSNGNLIRIAWDRQCPNCIIQYGGTNYPLVWGKQRTTVICNKCNRTYSLDTGAIFNGNKGKALMRYNVSYSGIGSILTVGN